MAAFLFQTEPAEYSYARLERGKGGTWAGVSDERALAHLRQVRKGDVVVIYHAGREQRAAGVARATCDAHPDPNLRDPRRVVVELEPVKPLEKPVPIAAFQEDPILRELGLSRDCRLAVMPLPAPQLARLMKLAGTRCG